MYDIIKPQGVDRVHGLISFKEGINMYTLKEFLDDKLVDNIKINTADKDLISKFGTIQISSVSVQELPIDSFVTKNELVLSTAIDCLNNQTKFMSLITDVKNSGASALFLSFKDNYVIPDEITKYADKISLPVFVLPWEIKFADIIKFINIRIHEKEIESYKITQEKLFTAYNNNDSFACAAEIISYFFSSPIEILGKSGYVKGSFGKKSNDFFDLEISLNNFLYGYLRVFSKPDKNKTDKKLIERYIGLPLSLWFNKENTENMILVKMKNDFVFNLANKNYDSYIDMIEQGVRLGFNLNSSYLCCALKLIPLTETNNRYSTESFNKAAEIRELIIQESNANGFNIMLADMGLMFIIYIDTLNPERKHIERDITQFLKGIEKKLSQQYISDKIYYGISEISSGNADFNNLYKNAILALHYCFDSDKKIYSVTYSDTQIFHIISVLKNNDMIYKMAAETINRLNYNEKGSQMDLSKTLIEYIKSGCNTSLTAKNLNLHRQSLLYRIEKIESLTGI